MNAELTCVFGPAAGEDENLPTRRSLLSRLRDLDDQASWRTFFETYWRLIYNVARRSGLSDAEAQDVVQESVIAVARKMPEFRYEPARGSFKQWLLLITRRRILDHYRRRYRSLPLANGTAEQLDARLREVPEPGPAPYAQIEAAWQHEWEAHLLQGALVRVRCTANPKHYQVFDYCVLQGLPAAKVASMLGMNAAQVYLAKHRVALSVRRAVAAIETELQRMSRT